jgi:hypothetical protein
MPGDRIHFHRRTNGFLNSGAANQGVNRFPFRCNLFRALFQSWPIGDVALETETVLWRAREAADGVTLRRERIREKFANAAAAACNDKVHRR